MANRLHRLRLGWTGWRNRLLAAPGFRRFAARCAPLRPVAHRYARDLFDLSAGFVYSQIAQALIESGLLAALAERPRDEAEAADIARLTPEAVRVLLRAGEPLALTEQVGDVWTLGTRGAAMSTSPGVAEMIAHHRLLYADLADPLAMLRGGGPGRLAALWRYDGTADPADMASYSALMAASQPMVAEQALAAYGFGRHRAMLDIGGGLGAFAETVCRATPGLSAAVFDLPPVAARASARFAGLDLPLRAIPGSFICDPLPGGHDLITLVRVAHDHDDGPVAALLARIHAALPPGGTLLIVEPLAEARSAPRVGASYFGFYLAAMRSGRPRSFAEYRGMARAAGFASARLLPTPLPLAASVIVIRR